MGVGEVTERGRLEEMATRLVESCRRRGADVAEASATSGWELQATVRLGEPELVREAGYRSASLRVMRDQRVALTSTSDWSDEGIERCVADAMSLVELTEPDEYAGPAPADRIFAGPHADLDLFDESLDRLGAEVALDRARELEALALEQDARLTLSEGATLSRVSRDSALVLSGGFHGARRGSFASLSVVPVVEDEDGKKRRGHDSTGARHLADLEPAEVVAQRAAERTLRKLGARKIATCQAPVIFDRDVSRSILSCFTSCVLGGAVWRRSSYLAERQGTQVASPQVCIVDDPLIERGPGSRAFDGEGLQSQVNLVVRDGILDTFLLDAYCGRKLGKPSTASAGRSGGSVQPGTSNLILRAGQVSRDELIRDTARGLLVTEMMGYGFNPVTGDFSRGASGFWIENGKICFPVSEVTISSNLDDMFQSIDALADDLRLQTAVAAPTFRVREMTIAGT